MAAGAVVAIKIPGVLPREHVIREGYLKNVRLAKRLSSVTGGRENMWDPPTDLSFFLRAIFEQRVKIARDFSTICKGTVAQRTLWRYKIDSRNVTAYLNYAQDVPLLNSSTNLILIALKEFRGKLSLVLQLLTFKFLFLTFFRRLLKFWENKIYSNLM